MVVRSRGLTDAAVARLPGVQAKLYAVAEEVVAEARTLATARALDKGDYRARIRVAGQRPDGSVVVAATDRKSLWLEEGTGIYGPRRRPIVPRRSRYLVFVAKKDYGPWKAGETVFTKSVRGRPASWVMRDAAAAVAARIGARFLNRRRFQG